MGLFWQNGDDGEVDEIKAVLGPDRSDDPSDVKTAPFRNEGSTNKAKHRLTFTREFI
jgi:hypothetical protein